MYAILYYKTRIDLTQLLVVNTPFQNIHVSTCAKLITNWIYYPM